MDGILQVQPNKSSHLCCLCSGWGSDGEAAVFGTRTPNNRSSKCLIAKPVLSEFLVHVLIYYYIFIIASLYIVLLVVLLLFTVFTLRLTTFCYRCRYSHKTYCVLRLLRRRCFVLANDFYIVWMCLWLVMAMVDP